MLWMIVREINRSQTYLRILRWATFSSFGWLSEYSSGLKR